MANQTWALDPTHSELQFKIKHLMISTVSGQFSQFKATVETDDDDFTNAKIHFEAPVDSISTNNDQRDAHKLYGTLIMRGVSKKIALNAEFGGITKDPWGNTRTGFSVTGKINRQDFGMSFGAVSETGGLLLGDEVKINANVQFVKEAVAYAA